MQKFLVTVGCAIKYDGKFLLVKHPHEVQAAAFLAFPGGEAALVDGNEDMDFLIQAVKRTIFEELGLKLVDPIHFVTSSYFRHYRTKEPAIDMVFYSEVKRPDPEVLSFIEQTPDNYYWLNMHQAITHQRSSPWLQNYMACIDDKFGVVGCCS